MPWTDTARIISAEDGLKRGSKCHSCEATKLFQTITFKPEQGGSHYAMIRTVVFCLNDCTA